MAAIDTRDKRSSAIHVGLPWRCQYPVADGTIGQADRQHTAWLYSGVLAEEPETGSPITSICTIGQYVSRIDTTGQYVSALRTTGQHVNQLTTTGDIAEC